MKGCGHIPMRRCVACRRVAPKPELLRLTYHGGEIVVDEKACLPGRGAYLCRSKRCVEEALRRRLLAKALRLQSDTLLSATEEDRLRSLI